MAPRPAAPEPQTLITVMIAPGETYYAEIDRWIGKADDVNIILRKTTETDVFLSYAHDDIGTVEKLAKSMEAQGWRVFWDRTILPGDRWHAVIEHALESAKCVVVVWSPNSIKSEWVREEAAYGKERSVLIPVLMGAPSPPLGFKTIQAANLSSWDGTLSSRDFQLFLTGVRRFIQQTIA